MKQKSRAKRLELLHQHLVTDTSGVRATGILLQEGPKGASPWDGTHCQGPAAGSVVLGQGRDRDRERERVSETERERDGEKER